MVARRWEEKVHEHEFGKGSGIIAGIGCWRLARWRNRGVGARAIGERPPFCRGIEQSERAEVWTRWESVRGGRRKGRGETSALSDCSIPLQNGGRTPMALAP